MARSGLGEEVEIESLIGREIKISRGRPPHGVQGRQSEGGMISEKGVDHIHWFFALF
jgi:hypothetical protein